MAGAIALQRCSIDSGPKTGWSPRDAGLRRYATASKLALARAALAMPAPNTAALESATDFLRRVARIEAAQCPQCKVGTLRVIETLAGQRRLAAPLADAPWAAVCRGPP